ncbi:MAG: response regulator transcription factor [Dehalococcoidales bacterium]|nr:MAG: response regulator transcription factor [Dehalococcoidales bacterium]
MDKIKILIADDHAVVREGTRQILDHEPDLEVVAEAADGEEAVKLVGSSKPNVAIIDIAMPKVDGIEATKQIKVLYPSIAVLILSAFDDDQFVFSLLEAGAAGYLLKSVRGHELVDAVRAVYAGESVLHPSIARKVLNRFVPAAEKTGREELAEVLSKREVEVLRLATKGLSNQDIANELCLSLRTIQAHLGHIFNKLGVSSRTEAVVHALKEGWITFEDVP